MITGLRLVGVEGIETTNLGEVKKAFAKALARTDLALIIISEEFSAKIRDEIDKQRAISMTPLIVEIPGHKGPIAEVKWSDLVSKTVGIKI